MKQLRNHLQVLSLVGLISSCSPMNFDQVETLISPSQEEPVALTLPDAYEVLRTQFEVQTNAAHFEQLNLEENQTSLTFQIQKPDNTYYNELDVNQMIFKENGQRITNFQLQSNFESIQQSVDIVFAVDVTGSMSSTIESAKTRLIDFIDRSRAQGYHTRMCLITFGDLTVQNCNRFYNNNPKETSSLDEVNELKSEITKLRALTGGQDPGGRDFNENPMRAVIDAAQAPWAVNSQRFLILITDDGFLYSPDNQGDVGLGAPFMSQVLSAIDQSQMKIFAVTPNLSGYNSDFWTRENNRWSRLPSIVSASKGEHFLFNDLIRGRITLDTVLNQIMSHVRSTYQINFVADHNPGLNPGLSINNRQFIINIPNYPDFRVNIINKQSNLPNGRGEYNRQWRISNKRIKSSSIEVKINEQLQTSGYQIQDGILVFNQAPSKAAKISINYQFEDLKDSLNQRPLIIDKSHNPELLSVFVNGFKARMNADILIEKNLEGQWSLNLSDSALSSDLFQIAALQGASIQVFVTK